MRSFFCFKEKRYQLVILVFLLLALYVEAPLFITNSFYIPGFLTILSIPFLLFIDRKYIYWSDLRFLVKVFLVLLLTVLLSPGYDLLPHKLFSGLLQTTFSIIAGVFILKTMDQLSRDVVARVLFGLSIFILAGTFLEVVDLIKGISDAFRAVVYGMGEKGYSNYLADARDMELAGFSRPKFFSSEPSLVAIGFSIFSNGWLILSPQKKSYLIFFIGSAVMLYLTASPVIIVSFLMSSCIFLYHGACKKNILIYFCVGVSFLLIVVFSLFVIEGEVLVRLGNRVKEALQNAGEDAITSENLRLIFPFITMMDVITNSPFFGVGISGKDVLGRYTSLPFDSTTYILGNNNLATLFIYMGIVGATFFTIVFYQYLRRFLHGYEFLLLCALVIGFMQMMGAFESPRFWGYVFILIGVLKKSSLDRFIKIQKKPAVE